MIKKDCKYMHMVKLKKIKWLSNVLNKLEVGTFKKFSRPLRRRTVTG